jgi:CheY-like chemotaxis protein
VLIVDDNRDLAEALAHHLSASGYQVCVANDGVRALELARDFRPAVAVLDVGLPVMDGRELARHLLGTLSPAPLLVAMTGYGQDADLDACRAAGFARRLKKPVRPADVLAVTAELLHAAGRPRQDGIDEVT